MINFRLALIPVALVSMACTESVESEDIRTSGIYPEISVKANGNGNSAVSVRLKVGGDDSNTFLELTGDDKLEATAGGVTKRLTDDDDNHYYSANFSVDEEGTEFTIAFRRSEADEEAPASVVVLPAPFDMELAASEVSRADGDLDYSWDAGSSGGIHWELDGDCILGDEGTTPDDGSNTIDAGDIEARAGDDEESCSVSLTLTREDEGTIDDAFTEGGSITAAHIRSEQFTSIP